MPPQFAAPETLSALIKRLSDRARACRFAGSRGVTLGDLLQAIGRRAYGPLLVGIGLFSISPLTAVPGMTWLAAALTAIVALQMAVGRRTPWLPQRALRLRVPCGPLLAALDQARPWAERLDRLVRPRFRFLAEPPWSNGVALLIVSAALVTIPLGFFPLAPLAPGLAVLLLGLGIAAKDGAVLAIGAASVATAGGLVFWAFG